jgi:hypothetical protein
MVDVLIHLCKNETMKPVEIVLSREGSDERE